MENIASEKDYKEWIISLDVEGTSYNQPNARGSLILQIHKQQKTNSNLLLWKIISLRKG